MCIHANNNFELKQKLGSSLQIPKKAYTDTGKILEKPDEHLLTRFSGNLDSGDKKRQFAKDFLKSMKNQQLKTLLR